MFFQHKRLWQAGLCLGLGMLVWTLNGPSAMAKTAKAEQPANADQTQAQKAVEVPTAQAATTRAQAPVHAIQSVRLTWPLVSGAVQYEVVVKRTADAQAADVVWQQKQIFTNGVEVKLAQYGSAASEFFWQVRPLDYSGKPIGGFSDLQPVTAAGNTLNPTAPLPTTQFEQMDYMPLYPVYSWVPTAGAKQHVVQVWREKNFQDVLIRTLPAEEYDIYEDGGYTVPGRYFWRVRAVAADGTPLSGWSQKVHFRVENKAPIAALGDSITHGGGVMSVPPGYTLYDWETYSPVPVKNLGYSGNTTADMLERFERDVLPFQPRVLVVMGGVNDYRGGTLGWTTVENLAGIRDKCNVYGIIPVFMTVTPINPALFSRAGIETPPTDWQVHQQYINAWVMSQQYAVDVSTMLTDGAGCLRRDYTTDGLHPDYFGKKYIGETIGHYLAQHFPWITNTLVKKQPVQG